MSILRYRIEKIITNRFELGASSPSDKLDLSLSFHFKVNQEERLVACLSSYGYNRGKNIAMELELVCYFKVEEECFNSLIKESILRIEPNILQYLATIAVGAARGEIHARCSLVDSPLQERVLPPIDLTKIITTPAEFIL